MSIEERSRFFSLRKEFAMRDDDLIDENTQYAVDYTANLKLEKIEYEGKRYVDILPLLCPK